MMQTKIAVCASGEGANFAAIVDASRVGSLQAEIVGLIVNRPGAGALKRAEKFQIPAMVLSPKAYPNPQAWDHLLAQQLQKWRAEWLVLAGFLALVGPETLKAMAGRAVNIHPSLLPKHGGAGMYGERVHQSVLAAKDKETGVTVHLLDSRYDSGRILAQEKVPVLPGDTPATLGARVKAVELSLYPRVLNDLVTGHITIS